MNERLRMRSGDANNPVTRAAQRRIKSENDLVRPIFLTQTRFKSWQRRAVAARDAIFHLLELLEADTHAVILPRAGELQSRNIIVSQPKIKCALKIRAQNCCSTGLKFHGRSLDFDFSPHEGLLPRDWG